MISERELDELYLLYGFHKQDVIDDTIVYTYREGYFSNAEIVELVKDNPETKRVKSDYAELGYSVHIIYYNSISEAKDALFRGFFRIEQSNKRTLQEYKNFCDSQTGKIRDAFPNFMYSYIQGDYYFDSIKRSDDLVCEVCEYLLSDGPRLIILEAAAGFGKTCTSYEVVKYIVENNDKVIPLLAELSKNRKANIFKYVLLSEMDSKFTQLSYELVMNEILAGNIPLVIDGFDELLSKGEDGSLSSVSSDKEDVQSMLDTIASVLGENSNAKILLTSRKSSIFAGDAFDDWVDRRIPNCNILRIQIAEPSITTWIGEERVRALSNNGIDISNVSNPVLLTILRNTKLEDFGSRFKTIDDLLQDYFDLLLGRERERQLLRLTVQEQYDIMKKLAAYFVSFDFSAEESSFIKDIISEIVENDINEYLNRYLIESSFDAESKPSSRDEFIMKLVHHALLDRKVSNNRIGFINDFIFGLLICDALQSNALDTSRINAKFLDIALTAYSVKPLGKKEAFWKLMVPSIVKTSNQQQLSLGLSYFRRIIRDYKDETFDSIIFEKETDWNRHRFEDCIFIACTFENCILHTSSFISCQFYYCKFYEISVISDSDIPCNLIFLGGFGHEEFAKASEYSCPDVDNSIDYRKTVLQQFWKIGYNRAERRRSTTTLFKGTTTNQKDGIAKAISDLVSEGILKEKARCYELDTSRMTEIREILGRE